MFIYHHQSSSSLHTFINHHPSSPSTRSYMFINCHPPSCQAPLTHPSFLFSHHIGTSQVETPYNTAEPNQQQQSIRYPNPITPYPYPNPDSNWSIPKYQILHIIPRRSSCLFPLFQHHLPSPLFPYRSNPNRKHQSPHNTTGPDYRS
jgi:hypothetical protein